MEPISVTNPIGLAMERVRQVLFRPFDLGKWFIIGFCAWLAGLGERVGGGGNFNSGSSNSQHGDFHQQLEHAHNYILENLYWIVPLTIFVIALCLSLWVLFIWLNSRGKFMFLHCVALNRSEIVEPWNRFADLANSLFWFRLVLGLMGMVLTLPLLALMLFSIIPMFLHDTWNFVGIMILLAFGMGMVAIGILFLLIRKLTTDFVVPIMFLRGSRCLAAWNEFRKLLGANFSQFVLYLLFQIAIHIIIAVAVLIVVIVTCCIAGCLLSIPYLGTVLLLPVSVFNRSYSLYYLAQYGSAYNVFQPATTP